MVNKFGTTIDKKVQMSTLVSGKKIDPKTKFNRLGVASKHLPDDMKSEQTALLIQNLLQSKPLLYRRFIPPKIVKQTAAAPKSNPMALASQRGRT